MKKGTILEVGKCYRSTSSWGKLYFHVVAKVCTLKSGDRLLVEMEKSEYGNTMTPPYEVDVWPVGEEYVTEEIPMEEFKARLQ